MSTIETPPLELLTVAEVAAVLRVSRATAYRLIEAGELPAHRVGGSIRIDKAELLSSVLTTRVEENPE
jgi:excisionase family DNA binding protein